MTAGTGVFLSHNWGKDESGRDNHYRLSLINKGLQELDDQTWFDKECMAGDIAEKMSKGIEKTKCKIIFIKQRNHNKVNSANIKDNFETWIWLCIEKK